MLYMLHIIYVYNIYVIHVITTHHVSCEHNGDLMVILSDECVVGFAVRTDLAPHASYRTDQQSNVSPRLYLCYFYACYVYVVFLGPRARRESQV